ncbi:diguanylate cyclase domain-containing protein, partial [Faecalibacterium prausnitzii]|uniref:diguanylate cyclase domain-containing protein n=1 Tax=Faecalibacterium prausnitzii TaxID=853 RepID=UPI0015DEED63
YIEVGGRGCMLELVTRLTDGRWLDMGGHRLLLDRCNGMERSAFLDPLTGAYTRRYFDKFLAGGEMHGGVAMIDVNQFKSVNDSFGHLVGDEALQTVAAAMQSCLRQTDILIRYGGDEFLLLMPQNAACLRLPGIDGKAKMSKSLGNCIYLSEEPEDIEKKVKSMFTDPNHLRVQDPGKVEGNPVFIYLDAFCRPEHFAEFWPEYQNLDEVKAHYQRGGLGDMKVKKFLNSVMQAELEPIRTRRKEWEQRLPEVVEILKEGSAYAEKTAAATLDEVRKAMRIDYFENDNLLK